MPLQEGHADELHGALAAAGGARPSASVALDGLVATGAPDAAAGCALLAPGAAELRQLSLVAHGAAPFPATVDHVRRELSGLTSARVRGGGSGRLFPFSEPEGPSCRRSCT